VRCGGSVIVQSTHEPEDVEGRIEAFLVYVRKHIEDLPQEVGPVLSVVAC
jgi:hypothetical protein